MGTALSISPTSRKKAILDEGQDVNSNKGKSFKPHSVIVSALPWRKLIPSSTNKNSAKKVTPKPSEAHADKNNQLDHTNNENIKKSQQPGSNPKARAVPLTGITPKVPTQTLQRESVGEINQNGKVSTVQKQCGTLSPSPRRVIVQASTGELLGCLGEFMCRRCYKLKKLTSVEVILWFRNIDRLLLLQGWQDQGFITPANLVFVYLLCKETVTDEIDDVNELQGTFLSCLYLAYSYMGNEISYPLKPFMIDANKDVFWDRSLDIIDRMSGQMLRLNADPHFFTDVFQDLKDEGACKEAPDR